MLVRTLFGALVWLDARTRRLGDLGQRHDAGANDFQHILAMSAEYQVVDFR